MPIDIGSMPVSRSDLSGQMPSSQTSTPNMEFEQGGRPEPGSQAGRLFDEMLSLESEFKQAERVASELRRIANDRRVSLRQPGAVARLEANRAFNAATLLGAKYQSKKREYELVQRESDRAATQQMEIEGTRQRSEIQMEKERKSRGEAAAELDARQQEDRTEKALEERHVNRREAQEVWRYAQGRLKMGANESSERGQRIGGIAKSVADGILSLDEARDEIDTMYDEAQPPSRAQQRSEEAAERAARGETRTVENIGRDMMGDAVSEAKRATPEDLDPGDLMEKPEAERKEMASTAYRRWLTKWGNTASDEDKNAAWAAIVAEFGG